MAVQYILRLQTPSVCSSSVIEKPAGIDVLQEYREALANTEAKASQANEERDNRPNKKRPPRDAQDPLEPKIAGALLLQSLLKLPSPHNQIVLDR